MDSIPVVAITCNVGVSLLGKDSFQEIDIAGITTPITKYSFIVKDVAKLADTIRRAFSIARKGRPGPVLVDIPKDVTANKAEFTSREPVLPQADDSTFCDTDIETAVSMIEKAKKPYIFVGGGAIRSDASAELKAFVDKVDAPVCDTLMGKGAYDGTSGNYTGMLGMHGTKASNFGVSECDLLIAIGTRFSDRILGNPDSFAKQAKILQIDIDPVEINKNIIVSHSIIGDVKRVLAKINEKLGQQQHSEWISHVLGIRDKYPMTYPPTGLSGPYMIEKIYEMADNAIMVTEVGQHQMWTAQYFKYKKPRTLLSSGGLGTMGYGLGAAIGAQCANPDKTVVNIAGDGCFRMNMNELATAARQKLPIIEVIVNNHVLGMVRQWQTLFYEQHYSATVLDDGVDYVRIAEAMGATARRVTTREEFDAAFAEALECKTPFVIDAIIDSDDKVWPMVAPGTAIDKCFDGADYEKDEK
jgi:acetolactate synthase-1/2/3 large subunit